MTNSGPPLNGRSVINNFYLPRTDEFCDMIRWTDGIDQTMDEVETIMDDLDETMGDVEGAMDGLWEEFS